MLMLMLQLTVTAMKPEEAEAVSIVDTDCEVEFDAPPAVLDGTPDAVSGGAVRHLGDVGGDLIPLSLSEVASAG